MNVHGIRKSLGIVALSAVAAVLCGSCQGRRTSTVTPTGDTVEVEVVIPVDTLTTI